jgi:ABC-type multidrug transport system ATPase subunit
MINGCLIDRNQMQSISCYIQQDDLFFGTLTVKEHLIFHVCLIFIYKYDLIIIIHN